MRAEWARPGPLADIPPLAARAGVTVRASTAIALQQRLAVTHRHHVALQPEGWAELKEQAAAIRRETLDDLAGWVDRFAAAAAGTGAVVHRAATGADAVRIVEAILARRDRRLVVKGKSMATEEIHLNHHLEAAGYEVVETDLGEFIVQLADERPSHIIAPAIHKTKADVAALFSDLAGAELPADHQALGAFARAYLRSRFLAADAGITGGNFLCADTGSVVLVTNEGNGRMCASLPEVHIAVVGIEKVIPRATDLGVLVPVLVKAATGQELSTYVQVLTGPRRAGERDGPAELHIVLLDNGRSRIAAGAYRDVLACIRCGACQLACPVYRTIGGHAYGATYGGPIGAVLSPLLDPSEANRELPWASSLCGACAEVCPVQIPLHDFLADLRAEWPRPAARAGWRAWSAMWSTSPGYRVSSALAGVGGRIARTLRVRGPGPARAWSAGRELPRLQPGAFRRWWRRR